VLLGVATTLVVGGFFVSNMVMAEYEDGTVLTVTDQATLLSALADVNVGTITIGNNFPVTEKIDITRPVTIDGAGKTITMSGNVPETWSSDTAYVFQVYGTTGVTIKDISLTHGNAGLLINGSTATLSGTIDVSGNGFGGIESSNSTLIVSGATLTNTTEAYGLPTLWEDGTTGTTVTGFAGTKNTTIKPTQVQYYMNAENVIKRILINSTTPEVVISDLNQAVIITVDSGTNNTTLNLDALITNGTGTLPSIIINSSNANISIPDSTLVTSADPNWNGIMMAPTVTSVTLPVISGQTLSPSTAIEIGFSGAKLTFDKAVKITMLGQAGKRAGYTRNGEAFTEITNVCSADTQDAGNALVQDSECKIDSGADLVIWTKHFTTFTAYTQTAKRSSSSGSRAIPATPAVPTVNPVVVTPTSVVGQVLGAESFTFTKSMKKGSKGDEVMELQKFLNDAGYDCGIADGKFGQKTKDAVIKFQLANGLKGDGSVGANTRVVLNKSKDNDSQVLGAESFVFTKLLKKGSIGDEVMELQKFLNAAGFDCGIADGKFGPKTKAAVIKFQIANGLKGDGVVGALTRAVLNK